MNHLLITDILLIINEFYFLKKQYYIANHFQTVFHSENSSTQIFHLEKETEKRLANHP